ncbi:MAG: single-stranded DNA-binding protein [Candidatus Heimdallarchaeota archaeon]|nr:single-stranded DNA-binding protein [Candidatus Heimdallarchaeota archaeon]
MPFIKVKDLKPEKQPGIDIIVRVIAKNEPRSVKTKYGMSRVCDLKVGDETGTVTLSLWGSKINEASFGDLLEIKDGYCNVWQGKPQLSLGRNGVMRKIDDPNFPDAKTILNKFIEESSEEEDE